MKALDSIQVDAPKKRIHDLHGQIRGHKIRIEVYEDNSIFPSAYGEYFPIFLDELKVWQRSSGIICSPEVDENGFVVKLNI